MLTDCLGPQRPVSLSLGARRVGRDCKVTQWGRLIRAGVEEGSPLGSAETHPAYHHHSPPTLPAADGTVLGCGREGDTAMNKRFKNPCHNSEDVEKLEPCGLLVEWKMVQPVWKTT